MKYKNGSGKKSGMKKKTVTDNRGPAGDVPSEWLYLALEDGMLRRIYELLKDGTEQKAELWQEADILEISMRDAGALDMEPMETDPEDEALFSCMEAYGAKRVYAVEFCQGSFEEARRVMEYITGQLGGIFCRDTEDLMPRVGMSPAATER